MGIKISQGFTRTGSDPIDEVFVLSKAEMKAIKDDLMPEKYFAVCKDDAKFYLYNKENSVDENTGKFRILQGGGSGTDAYPDLTDLPKINGVTLLGDKSSTDLGIITETVDDLENYYLKSETYDKTEVDNLISAAISGGFVKVDTLPEASAATMNKIYLVPKGSGRKTSNICDEYITIAIVDNTDPENPVTTYDWELIGDTAVNLDNYYDKNETDALLADKIDNPTTKADGQVLAYDETNDEWIAKDVQGGDATAKYDYKTNIAVGGISSGTDIAKTDELADLIKQMLVTTYYPTYTAPSASLSYGADTLVEVKSTISALNATVGYNAGAITLQGQKQNNRGGAATKYYISTNGADTEFSNESESSGAFSVPGLTRSTKGNIVVTGKVDYAQGPQPKDSTGADYQSPLAAGSVTSSKTIKFIQAFYYGASNSTDVNDFTGLTKLVQEKGSKTLNITTANQHLTFIYDSSYGDLTSIKDANNFELIDGWTKTTKTIDGLSYNVYVANSATTDTNAKFIFAF